MMKCSRLISFILIFLLIVTSSFGLFAKNKIKSYTAIDSVAAGDTLLQNYSFESDLQGWSAQDGLDGVELPSAYSDQVSISTAYAASGTKSAHMVGSKDCKVVAVASSPVMVTPSTTYTAFASARIDDGWVLIGLRYFDASGNTIGTYWGNRTSLPAGSTTTIQVSDVAPETAVNASVVLATNKDASFDDVLISAKFTDLGAQISINSSCNGTAYSVDPQGRDIAYSVVAGASGVDARLVGIDAITAAVTTDLPVPGAMGAWNAATAPDGTVYITAYNYSDANIGGRLYSYTPGADHVVNIGAPVPGDTFTYGATSSPDGSIYGGTYPSAALWKYTPGVGFSILAKPILPGMEYVRSVAYDATTGLVFAGTVGSAHIVACPADGNGPFTEVLPAEYAKYAWVYNMSAGDGHVFARVTDDHGDDHLVVIKVWRAEDGSIQSTLEKDVFGISYSGTSNVVNGKVYYAKAGLLYSYEINGANETNLNVNSGIFARQWIVKQLADQANYPGYTLVGTNSGGIVARYNIDTGRFDRNQVASLPKAVTTIESMVGGPDGKVYSAGYLVGGLGVYSPMRSDLQFQRASTLGYWQAEGMTVLGDRIYQGIYPGAYSQSFTPADAVNGVRPTVDFTIGNDQDRPYGMLSAEGKIYAGTMATYGQTSGALSVFDPATGSLQVYRDIVPNQSVVSLTYSAGKVYGGSLVWGGLGSQPTEPEAKMLIFDTATQTSSTVDLPVRGLRAITAIAAAPDGKIWMMAQNYIFAYDPVTGQFVNSQNVYQDHTYPGPDSTGRISAYDSQMILGKDGQIYVAFQQAHFFKLDPTNGQITNLFDGEVQSITMDGYGNIYLGYKDTRMLRYVPF